MQRSASHVLGRARMDARTAESTVMSRTGELAPAGAREQVNASTTALACADRRLFVVAMIALQRVATLTAAPSLGRCFRRRCIALLLIANLLPAIALMVLYSRKRGAPRAEQGGLGSGRLHVRLVALFTAIAAVPTVLVAIFASLLFQSGLEFWFSNRARGMLENTAAIAQSVYTQEADRVASETLAMSADVAGYLRQVPIDDPRFAEAFADPSVQP